MNAPILKNNGSHRMPHKGRMAGVAFTGRALRDLNFAMGLNCFATGSGLLAVNEAAENLQYRENCPIIDAGTVASPESLTVAVNESGRQLLVPFVERSVSAILPNGERIPSLQIFDVTAANEVVSKYNSTLAKLKRTVTGLLGIGTSGIPVYYRHPDGNPEHVDRREYGLVDDLSVGSDGLYGRIAYNEFGVQLLKEVKGLRISPVWYLKPLPGSQDMSRTRPHHLLSLGLTQFPNISTAVAVNEQPKTNNTMKPELLKALLIALGFNEQRIAATIAGDPDAISITEAQSAFAPYATAANEAPKISGLQKQIDDLTAEKTLTAASLKAANELVGEFKRTIAANEVEAAISSGKMTPAQKEAQIKKLVDAEDFAVACNELSAAENGKAMKTKAATDALAKTQSEGLLAANEANEKFMELVAANEAKGLGYEDAWTAAENSVEGKRLQALIKQKEGQ